MKAAENNDLPNTKETRTLMNDTSAGKLEASQKPRYF